MLAACAGSHPEGAAAEAPVPGLGGVAMIYYDVHGRTARELAGEMRRLGPKTAQGAFFGETHWDIHWQTRSKNVGAYCEITDVQVRMEATMTLPRWTPPPDTEPGLLGQWKTYLAALETHEVGHKEIAARSAREIEDVLRRYTGNCLSLNAETRRLTDPVLQRLEAEQAQYDATTRHGATQGAIFPPRRAMTPPPVY
jgi:predicted secreted Zn-dependent protease